MSTIYYVIAEYLSAAAMSTVRTYTSDSWRVNIVGFFIIIGLLRLTNLNYYLSQLVGFETKVDHVGGGAFNFTNYIAVIALALIFIAKRSVWTTRWQSLWPYGVLMTIYVSNAVFAPYTNPSWVAYQMLFILVAMVLHIYVRRRDTGLDLRVRTSIKWLFHILMVFVVFCLLAVLAQYSFSYYLSEYNDAFVHSLDDFGVMKQRFGYLLGFLVSYVIFYKKGISKWLFLAVIMLSGFGIRSFVIGLIGAAGLFTIRRPIYFMISAAVSVGFVAFFLSNYFENIIFDTRFYSFYNAYDIMKTYAFGVGLGGYPVYTELYSNSLIAQFYNVNAVLDFVPTAPESDLVHLFGSLGLIAGAIHLMIQGRILWLTYKLFGWLTQFDRFLLFYFCFMTFFGISEDSIFSVNYWIFFGISTGILSAAAARKRQKMNTAHA